MSRLLTPRDIKDARFTGYGIWREKYDAGQVDEFLDDACYTVNALTVKYRRMRHVPIRTPRHKWIRRR